MKDRSATYLLAAIMLAGLLLRLWDISEPWIGLKDFTGALHAQIAENYLRFGYLGTALGPVTNFDPHPDHFTYYLHHPILFNIVLSLPMQVLGTSERVARSLPVVFSVLGILIIFRLIRIHWNRRIALYGAFFTSFAPMSVYFGRMVNEETMAMPLIAFLVMLYTERYRDREPGLPPLFFIVLFIGLLTAWPVYYLAGFIFLHLLLSGRRNGRDARGMLILALLVIAAAGIFLVHGKYLTGKWGGNLLTIFLERSGSVQELMARGSYARTLPRWFVGFFTPVMLALTGVHLIASLTGNAKNPPGGVLALVLLYLVAITHILIFREGALRHEFWLYYFIPPLAVSSAAGLAALESLFRHARSRAAVTTAVLGIFLVLSIVRLDAVFAIDRFQDIPDLGKWIRSRTPEDAGILVIGPDLARFGYSPLHFDYYYEPVYTWPMPHLGYYARRRIRWGIRDIEELETLLSNPGDLTYAVMTKEYWDSLVQASYELLATRKREIEPGEWGKGPSVSIRLFDLRRNVSPDSR